MRLFDAPLAIVDLETTGTHPAFDRVTEIAVIEAEAGEVTSQWSTLVDPETSIPPAIQALTGITNQMVAGAPTFGALAGELYVDLRRPGVLARRRSTVAVLPGHIARRAAQRFPAAP